MFTFAGPSGESWHLTQVWLELNATNSAEQDHPKDLIWWPRILIWKVKTPFQKKQKKEKKTEEKVDEEAEETLTQKEELQES